MGLFDMTHRAVLMLAAFAWAMPSPLFGEVDAMRPNILFILADDFGYECVGANGGESYKTPNLDALAASGMRFDHAYAQPLCTPTRVQLMTGQSNARNYIGFGKLPPGSRTFASLLADAGYRTAMTGKWQLGREPDLPREAGFHEHLLWQHTLPRTDSMDGDTRYGEPVFERDGHPVPAPAGAYGPDLMVDFACDFMARHKDGPFLLYYSDVLPHCPFVPTPDSPEWKTRNARSLEYKGDVEFFDDMVAHMDKNVGRLLAKLDELGIRENTLVLFLGDNGCDSPIVSRWRGREIRAGKGKTTTAGMHVPFIASWPGVVPAGSVCDAMVDTTDFLPTFCELGGVVPPGEPVLDGVGFVPLLRGDKQPGREWIYSWYSVSGTEDRLTESAFDKRYKLYSDGRFFDMALDPSEKTPLRTTALEDAAVSARARLASVLAAFKDVRPKSLRGTESTSLPPRSTSRLLSSSP